MGDVSEVWTEGSTTAVDGLAPEDGLDACG